MIVTDLAQTHLDDIFDSIAQDTSRRHAAL